MSLNHPPAVPDAEPAIAARIAQAMPSLTPIHRRMGESVLPWLTQPQAALPAADPSSSCTDPS